MQIIINLEQLTWAISQLVNLENGGNIRYEGNTTFQQLKAELQGMVDTKVAYVPAPPQVLAVMTPDQVNDVVLRVGDKVADLARVGVQSSAEMGAAVMGHVNGAVAAITADVERSDAMLTAAIVQTGQDVVQALTQAEAAA